ncbi:MAG TPA: hypothetical protein VKU01_10045 [Bryobacteraceae bacterium]|nr:hypothetical protein [Bryobacteraceae bacterium]
MKRYATLLLLFPALLSAGDNQSQVKHTQGAVTRIAATKRPADASLSSTGEVIGANFTIGASSCKFFESSLDYVDASRVSITLLSDGATDISKTRILPFFAVFTGAYYVSNGAVIHGSDFYYIDGGGATVDVQGRYLGIRVCNDDSNAITYLQLTARGSAN